MNAWNFKKAFLKGFFGNMKADEYSFSKIDDINEKCDQSPCKKILQLSNDTDVIFHGESSKVCALNKKLSESEKSSEKYQKLLSYLQTSRFPLIAKKFNEYYGTSFNESAVSWPEFSEMFDLYYCASYNSKIPKSSIPKFSSKWEEKLKRLKFYHQFLSHYGQNGGELSKHASNAFFTIIRNKVHEKIKGESQLEYIHFSGHDISMAGILTQIADLESYSQREDAFIPFASYLEISLYGSGNNLQNENLDNLTVEVNFNGKPLSLKGFGTSIISWNQFEELLVSGIDSNYEKECLKGKINLRRR